MKHPTISRKIYLGEKIVKVELVHPAEPETEIDLCWQSQITFRKFSSKRTSHYKIKLANLVRSNRGLGQIDALLLSVHWLQDCDHDV